MLRIFYLPYTSFLILSISVGRTHSTLVCDWLTTVSGIGSTAISSGL